MVAVALLLVGIAGVAVGAGMIGYALGAANGRSEERRVWEAILDRASNLSRAEGLTPTEAVDELRRVFNR